MVTTELPSRRTNACVPCHERKVRCDAGDVGVPCSRCVSKGRSQACTLVPSRRQRRAVRRAIEPTRERVEQDATSSERTIADDGVAEEDAQIRTLQLMARDSNPNSLSAPTDQVHGSPEVIEYIDRLNSVSILSEAIGQRKRKRLIRFGNPVSTNFSARQRETFGLESSDILYLESKRVFEVLPKRPCIKLIRLWLDHVYPYTPVLDAATLFDEFDRGVCSHFLLYALLANAVHYASIEDLRDIGFSDRCAAQREYVHRAQILFDFGCERRQFTLLQGSVILSSIQASFAPIKDFRFWFHNAVRIATQMGLHRRDLGEDVNPATHQLCQRIWWVIYTRDILFNLSGFVNARCVNDAEVDVDPVNEDDWTDAFDSQVPASHLIRLHRAFFVQRCKIASLEAEFLRLSRKNSLSITQPSAQEFSDKLVSWRNNLPDVLQPTRIIAWTTNNVWIIILMALAYRLECVFFRTAREHFRQRDDSAGMAWCREQLFGCIFELDAFIGRAIVNSLVQFAPGSFIVCACNLVAFHIEVALDEECTPSQKTNAKTRIHVLLEYLHDVGEAWRMAKWTFKVSEWVVKRAGLMLQPSIPQDQSPSASIEMNDGAFLAPFGFDANEAFPAQWIQDFLDQNFFGQLHDEVFTFDQN